MTSRQQPPFAKFPQNVQGNMQIVNHTYDQFVMKSPEQNITRGRVPYRLIVDSSMRDRRKYPDANSYQIKLSGELREVITIQLVQGIVPQSEYIVNDYNNKIYFREGMPDECGPMLTATICPGNYCGAELAEIIGKEMTTTSQVQGKGYIYKTSIDKITDTITIRTDPPEPFSLYFTDDSNKSSGEYLDDSMGKILGFGPQNYTYEDGYVIDAETTNIPAQISFRFTGDFNAGFCTGYTGSFYMAAYGQTLVGQCCCSRASRGCVGCTGIQKHTCKYDENKLGESVEFTNAMSLDGQIVTATCFNNLDLDDIVKDINSSYRVKLMRTERTAPYPINLNKSPNVVLRIREADKLQSNNGNVDGGFSIIYFAGGGGAGTILSSTVADCKEIKYYNPPLGRLTDLNIELLTLDGYPYNTNGRDHLLEFEIMYMNAPGKYDLI